MEQGEGAADKTPAQRALDRIDAGGAQSDSGTVVPGHPRWGPPSEDEEHGEMPAAEEVRREARARWRSRARRLLVLLVPVAFGVGVHCGRFALGWEREPYPWNTFAGGVGAVFEGIERILQGAAWVIWGGVQLVFWPVVAGALLWFVAGLLGVPLAQRRSRRR